RDKLAMRMQARANGLLVPDFSPVYNYDRLRTFMDRVPPPWVLKPRSEAGAMGIKKVYSSEEVWRWLDELGDQQSFFHLEKFVPGEVYHVDSIIWQGQVQFALAHKYTQPPMDVAHHGGVFVTRTLARESEESQELLSLNKRLMDAFQIPRGVTHAEFIRAEDGRCYFLETAARVGGANIEQLVQAASGINLWSEWAKLEIAFARGESYLVPEDRGGYAGVLICLARQEHPDLSIFQDSEIVFRLEKKHHAGLIVASKERERVEDLISSYSERFAEEFLAVAPPLDKPPA
ncbi:MAG: ATP-grasp domain-containing protein, partial [Candidatus Promineifilaceae bacterium]|nr:ATP-grasp domain-containing protein [Candidatus Promineifilaceae bacterium]